MVDWLTNATDPSLTNAGVVVPDDELATLSETTIGSYEDMRSVLKTNKFTKKTLVDMLFKKNLGKITKKILNKKTRDDLLKEAGIVVN